MHIYVCVYLKIHIYIHMYVVHAFNITKSKVIASEIYKHRYRLTPSIWKTLKILRVATAKRLSHTVVHIPYQVSIVQR